MGAAISAVALAGSILAGSLVTAIAGLRITHETSVKYEDVDSPLREAKVEARNLEATCATFTLVNGFQTWGEDTAIALAWNGGSSNANKDVEEVLVPFSSEDTAISRHWNETAPLWMSIKNHGESPVCIAGVSIKIGDHFEWVLSGELGRICGAAYYESSRYVLPEDRYTQAPPCVWVERDHPIRLNLAVESEQIGYEVKDPTDLCRSPFMTWAPGNSAGAERRQISGGSPFDGTLIKSARLISSAVRLCGAATSQGPSFLSLSERIYCDMKTRNLYPVCEEGMEGVCFDLEDDELVEVKKPGAIGQRGIDHGASRLEKARVMQTFKKVIEWH